MKKILIIDSGIGGISTLNALRELLPLESFVYLADNANCPYGEKSKDFIQMRLEELLRGLDLSGIKLVVIACNTMTTSAITYLREKFDIPFVGIIPATKVANKLGIKKPLLIATPTTIDNLNIVDDNVLTYKAVGLAGIIDKYFFDKTIIEQSIEKIREEVDDKNIGAIILGCTHYSLARAQFEKVFDKYIPIIDGNEGVAKRTREVLEEKNLLEFEESAMSGRIELKLTNFETAEMVKYNRVLRG